MRCPRRPGQFFVRFNRSSLRYPAPLNIDQPMAYKKHLTVLMQLNIITTISKTGKKPTAIQPSLTLANTQGDAETSFRSLIFLFKKFNVHVLFLQFQRIDEGGQLAKACREELSDEVYLERLVRVILLLLINLGTHPIC